MAKKPKATRCKACNFKLEHEAYYCKKCTALVDLAQAPDSRIPDRSFGTKFNRFVAMNPLFKFGWSAVLIIALISGGYYFKNLNRAVTDNGSNNTFVLNVNTAYSPFACSNKFCHIAITITNKTDSAQHLVAVPVWITADGKVHAPADPRHSTGTVIYFGNIYCHAKLDLNFAAHEKVDFIGLCAEDLSKGELVKQIQLRDLAGKPIITTDLNQETPLL